MDQEQKIIPIILCGGSGTRLWPLSRKRAPKQFQSIVGDAPLLHQTLDRALLCAEAYPSDVITITTDDIKEETMHQLGEYHPKCLNHLLIEPCARDTAAAIAYAALYAKEEYGPDVILWVLPSDHHVADTHALGQALGPAAAIAKSGHLVTFGMTPTRPETGYGYIKTGKALANHQNAHEVEKFIEKPDQKIAQKYLDQGDYFWNSGMFVFSARSVIENYIENAPEIIAPLHNAFKEKKSITSNLYNQIPALPFDIAIMEKTDKAAIVPCDIGWSDVGSWESVWNIKEKDGHGNVRSGQTSCIDTKNCLIQSNNLLIATIGLKDLVIVENSDSILVANKNNGAAMKTLLFALNKTQSKKTIDPPAENRPWGSFKILSQTGNYKVKELTIIPNGKLSLQKHRHRSEIWTVISGEALVTLNGKETILKQQQSTFVPMGVTHRLENIGSENLIIVEIQCGDHLGEDDIIRFDDIYGRMDAA